MKLNDFQRDFAYSMESGESEQFDNFYRRIFPSLRNIEFITDKELQLKGLDKALTMHNGQVFYIDEKKRRKDYGDILLERWSNYEKKRKGWLYTTQCDYIVYAVLGSKKIYLLPTILLKRAWWENKNIWLSRYKEIKAPNLGYTTVSTAIPSDILLNEIKEQMYYKVA